MADNFVANAGAGGDTFASDDVGGVQYPRQKRALGRDGQTADVATLYSLLSAASTNATSVKGSAGTLYLIQATNTNASARWLKFYNKATAPTVGTDTPVLRILIPGNTAGAGIVIPIDVGLEFTTGIAFATTTGAADSDASAVAANEIAINLGYV